MTDVASAVPDAGMPKTAVLVVDDNATVRWLLAELLAVEGYETCEAGDADEAMQCMALRPDIQAVVTDIEMPGSMNGLAMAAKIRAAFPGTAILITSGRHHPSAADLPPGSAFLAKPWLPGDVISRLQQLLLSQPDAA